MNPNHTIDQTFVPMFALAGMLSFSTIAFAFNSGSTGADGILNPAVSTQIVLPADGILQYQSVNIPTGVTVTFLRNTLNTPIQLLVSGDMTVTGTIDIRGQDGKATGSYGDGNQADDGIPGDGGPGGFAGGRGGDNDAQLRVAIIRGGAGLGPGGGLGGTERADGCYGGVYYHYVGKGGAYAAAGSGYSPNATYCGTTDLFNIANPYGAETLTPLIGGSGGGGGVGRVSFGGSGGGGGGGAILVAVSGTLTVTGTIDATGGDAGGVSGSGSGANGSGGSGGAIKIMATTFAGKGTINASGGCINYNGSRRQYCASNQYGGSVGRIRVEADTVTFSGTSTPTFSAGTPGTVSTTNLPELRITTVAGVAVPATPTGNADVSLPADVANPVTVVFQTTNVPTGNTIKLRVVPAQGAIIEALSPAITGTQASGSASVNVSLPQGASVLQGIVSYTITVAQGEALSRFARNERVESIELVASPGRETVVQLVTVSGQRHIVPRGVLQLAGVNG